MSKDNAKIRPKVRLYVAGMLHTGARMALDEARSHYVRHVMRLGAGDAIGAFNAEFGEWEAAIDLQGKRDVILAIDSRIAEPRTAPDLWLAFSMIKNKSELVVEKATELGASALHAIVTQHSVVKHINLEKLEAHAIEAAEQCERHDVPTLHPHKNLGDFLGAWPEDRILLYGDESGRGAPLPALLPEIAGKKLGVLIGPEGGFSDHEHQMLRALPTGRGFGMGPRILRADTAAVAALACLLSATGAWNDAPHFRNHP